MTTIKDKLPKEFLEEMKELLKDEYESFLASYDEGKTSAIRVNTNKISVDSFRKLHLFNIDYDRDRLKWSPESFYIGADENPGQNPLHDAGAYYIQEPSAISVVGETPIEEGERILDLCAAPGGKSTYILTKLKNTGILISNEINPSRIKALGENLERFGAVNAAITNCNSKELLKFFKGFFDKVFIDAPCSGQGMFRKDEYAVSDWSESKVSQCCEIQRELIRDGYEMLREGGMLIYSTCTFTSRENEDVISDFTEEYKDAKLLSQNRIWPHRETGEGHFCARLVKGSSGEESCDDVRFFKKKAGKNSSKKKDSKKSSGRESLAYFHDFAEEVFTEDSIIYERIRKGNLLLKGGFLYLLPEELPDMSSLRTLRQGIVLGEMKKNRFEPSHSLAMALGRDDVRNCEDFSFESDETTKYISGESIETGKSRGWVLVLVNGVSLGWGKESGSVLKNRYPKGLRRNIRK